MNGKKPELRIGTIGFSYPGWRGPFYSEGTKPEGFLAAYARAFNAVELDTTFHSGTPKREHVEQWRRTAPENFRFCVKAPRAITHELPPQEGVGPMLEFLEGISGLGPKLGVVLLQYPPMFGVSQMRGLEGFLNGLPMDVRYAVEFRHRSWERADVVKILRHRKIAWVAADWLGPMRWPPVTADFIYLRLRGEREKFAKDTHEQLDVSARLKWWGERIEESSGRISTAWIFTANDYAGHAPGTARRFAGMLGQETGAAGGEPELFGQ